MPIELKPASALNDARYSIQKRPRQSLVGPFQDLNLDLSDGNLNTTGIGVGDLDRWSSIFLLLQLAAEDTGNALYLCFRAITSCTCDATTPCSSGKCVVDGCWAVDFTGKPETLGQSINNPCGSIAGRTDTLKFTFCVTRRKISLQHYKIRLRLIPVIDRRSSIQFPNYTFSKFLEPWVTLRVRAQLQSRS